MNIELKMSSGEPEGFERVGAGRPRPRCREMARAKATVSGYSGVTVEISQIEKTADRDADA